MLSPMDSARGFLSRSGRVRFATRARYASRVRWRGRLPVEQCRAGIETPWRRDEGSGKAALSQAKSPRSQAMVAVRLPTPKDSVRFAGDLPWGQTQKAAVLPCKQNDRERYPVTPPRRISTMVVLTVGIGAVPVRFRNAALRERSVQRQHRGLPNRSYRFESGRSHSLTCSSSSS